MGTPTAAYFKSPNDTLTDGTATLTGVAAGTPIIAIAACDFCAAADVTTPTGTAVSSGFTLLQTASAGTSQPNMKAWSATVDSAGGTVIGHGASGSAIGLLVVALTGAAAAFVDASAQTASGTPTTAHTAPSVTVPSATDDLLLVISAAADSDGGTTTTTGVYSGTAGMTARQNNTFDSGATRYLRVEALDEVLSASGATGTRALVYGASTDFCSITIALKGASGAPAATHRFFSVM